MTEKDLIKKLEGFSDHDYFGATTEDNLKGGWRQVAFMIGADPEMKPHRYSWRDFASYYSYLFRSSVVRPVAIGLSAFVIMIGGWAGMVSASFDTVPGDALYPVKIANERAQLVMTLSGEKKVKLHVEFASRRLDEVITLASVVDDGERDEQVKVAIESFTKEIEAASQQIDEIKVDDLDAAAELAKMMDRKVDEYEAAIKTSETELATEENLANVGEAKDAMDSADNKAVEVLVESHETAQAEETADDLENRFQKDLVEITTRLNLSESRLINVEGVLAEYELAQKDVHLTSINSIRATLGAIDPQVSEAMDYMAAGGFRKAFEILQNVKNELRTAESDIAVLEITITAEVVALQQVEAEQAAAELEAEAITTEEVVE